MQTRHTSLSFYGWAVTKECRLFHRVGKGGYRIVETFGIGFSKLGSDSVSPYGYRSTYAADSNVDKSQLANGY